MCCEGEYWLGSEKPGRPFEKLKRGEWERYFSVIRGMGGNMGEEGTVS